MTATLLSDRYRVISVLGSGGFCETFLAEDTQMPSGRLCVIKQLKPVANSPKVYQLVQNRFQREAAILEQLGGEHNQIPSLYAYFQADGKFYLVQEWIAGQTLTQKIEQNGCLTENEVFSILISLLNILKYVHSKGIIHRDIKPDNIILRSCDGKPVLIDFGAVRETMATVVNPDGNVSSLIIVGTPGFMPNEQAAGRPVFASDLYSLGLTAIYLLTGKFPQQLATDPYTGESIWERNSVSPNLAAVLDRAIQNHVRERYPTAQAMLDALQGTAFSIASNEHTFSQVSSHNTSFSRISAVKNSRQNGIFLGSIFIIGSLIGVSAIIGILFSNSFQSTNRKTSSSNLSKTQNSQNLQKPFSSSPSAPVTTHSQILSTFEPSITASANLPNYFHFIADSHFPDLQAAIKHIETLQMAGYEKPGVFWIRDYPNLSKKDSFVVYVATFRDRPSCLDYLKNYGNYNSQAYCAFASKDPKAPPNPLYFQQIN